jgi:quinol monooxygenase YgiN
VTGRLLTRINANSSHRSQLIRATPSPDAQDGLSNPHAFSLGTLRASGDLPVLLLETDCRTLEEEFDDATTKVAPYLEALYDAYLEALCEGVSMFARIVECQSKAGQSEQASNKLKNDVLPILQKQPGFVDFLTLTDRIDTERLVCISFWTSQEDADKSHRQHYDTINAALRSVLESPPTLETFAVDVSTAHRIAADRAA